MSMFKDVSWRSEDNELVCIANADLVSIYARRFQQEDGHPSDLDQKRSGILLVSTDTRRMGQSRRIDDGDTRRKRTPSCHLSIVPRSA